MQDNQEIELASGAKVRITLAPMAVSKNLYLAVFEEAKALKIDDNAVVDGNLCKDLFCAVITSRKVEAALKECLKSVTYNGFKADCDDIFEPVECRDDYFNVRLEVAQVNILPFTKSLLQQFRLVVGVLKTSPE